MRSGGGEYRDRAVRPYVITGGRARPCGDTLPPETLLVASGNGTLPGPAAREEHALLTMCEQPLSLAEAAAHLELPISVVSVLAADLVNAGHLTARCGDEQPARPDQGLLQEVLDGLRRLA